MIIQARYNGPPNSGNGGYCAGAFAGQLERDGAKEVTLRRPPPLETELLVRTDNGAVRVFDGADLVAEAAAAEVGGEVAVEPVSFAEARAVAPSHLGLINHPFPTCFVCGPQRAEGDGLRLPPGGVPDRRTATAWTVPDGVDEELVWAVLDCPGGWAVPLEGRPYVLGRLAARVDALPRAGDECVVMGQMLSEDGRKAYTYTSLYGTDGTLLATARGTWIAL